LAELRGSVARFSNITLVIYIIEEKGVYVLPIDATEHGAQQERKDNASIPYDCSEIVDGVANRYQD
jgi:hypothetical protein